MSTAQQSTETESATPSSASADPASSASTTTAPYLTSSSTIDYELQVTAPPIDEAIRQQLNQLRADLATLPVYTTNPHIQHYCTDKLLYKYIRARPQSLDKARSLLVETLQWRAEYRPDLILASQVEEECRSGKVLVKRTADCYGRPLIVMNNQYNKTNDHDAAIRQLVFQLELAAQRMTPPVEKSANTHHSQTSSALLAQPYYHGLDYTTACCAHACDCCTLCACVTGAGTACSLIL